MRQDSLVRASGGADHAPGTRSGAHACTVVYLARHGQTESNLLRRYAGRNAEPITDLGRGQMSGLAARLGLCGIGEIWTSEVRRARESAGVVGRALRVPVRVDERLSEMRLGPWEGMTESEVARAFPTAWALWCTLPDRLTLDERETLDTVSERITAAVRDAARVQHPVLLMSHVAPIRVAVLTALGLSLSHYKRLHIGNGDAVVIERASGQARRVGEERSLQHEFLLAGPTSAFA
jgi:broad specificity phosphatase PhoE